MPYGNIRSSCLSYRIHGVIDVNFDFKKNIDGKVVEELILLPDAYKSDVENMSEDAVEKEDGDIFSDSSSSVEDCDNDGPYWIENAVNIIDEVDETFGNLKKVDEAIFEPYTYFNQFFTDELFELIYIETNKYAIQNNSTFRTTVNEIRLFIGMLIRMSIVRLPRFKNYWSGDLNCSSISEKMSRDRFEKINKYIHFCDNNFIVTSQKSANYDRFL